MMPDSLRARFPTARALIVLVLGMGPFSTSFASEIFVAELNPTLASGEAGGFLASGFNFGTRFSSIDSVSLQVTSAGGFVGSSFTTDGGGVFSNSFDVVVDDGDQSEPTLSLEAGVAGQSTRFLTSGEPTTLELTARSSNPGLFTIDVFGGASAQIFDPDWPASLFDGQGRVSLINVRSFTFRPLLAQRVVSSNVEWFPLEDVTDARLIVIGTPVPEPGQSVLLLTGVFARLIWFRSRH